MIMVAGSRIRPRDAGAIRAIDVAKSVNSKLFNEALAMRIENNLDGVLERPCPKGLEYKLTSNHG